MKTMIRRHVRRGILRMAGRTAACAAAALVIAGFAVISPGAIEVGLVSDFSTGTQGWLRGTVQGGWLQLIADGNGNEGKLVTFARGDWSGDYLAAGVEGIRFTANCNGTQNAQLPLVMRVAFGNTGSPNQGGTWFASTEAIEVFVNQTETATIPIDAAGLVRVQGDASYEEVMSNVHTIRILHNPVPDSRGETLLALVRLDDIEAIGAPASIPDVVTADGAADPDAADGLERDAGQGALITQLSPNPVVVPGATPTRIGFALAEDAKVRLSVYDAAGRLVTTLANATLGAGVHELDWNGRDRSGARVAQGIYYVHLAIEGRGEESRALTILR